MSAGMHRKLSHREDVPLHGVLHNCGIIIQVAPSSVVELKAFLHPTVTLGANYKSTVNHIDVINF